MSATKQQVEKYLAEKILSELSDWLIDQNVTMSIDGQIVGIEELFFRYQEEKP
jgi:hypothetical protein